MDKLHIHIDTTIIYHKGPKSTELRKPPKAEVYLKSKDMWTYMDKKYIKNRNRVPAMEFSDNK